MSESNGQGGAKKAAHTRSLIPPFNFKKWIDEHRHEMVPPVCVKPVYEISDSFIAFCVGGPNSRNDYHVNETEEFFYQLEGNMILKVVDNGVFKDIPINEGEVPHSPQRPEAGSIGFVVEQVRRPEHVDRLRWYCDNEECRAIVHEDTFYMYQKGTLDLGALLAPIMNAFNEDSEQGKKLRTCPKCGLVKEAVKKAK